MTIETAPGHERRKIQTAYTPVGQKPWLTDDQGPMGFRCLHPLDPGVVVRYPIEAAMKYLHREHFLEDYRRCQFDGCVCRCHLAA